MLVCCHLQYLLGMLHFQCVLAPGTLPEWGRKSPRIIAASGASSQTRGREEARAGEREGLGSLLEGALHTWWLHHTSDGITWSVLLGFEHTVLLSALRGMGGKSSVFWTQLCPYPEWIAWEGFASSLKRTYCAFTITIWDRAQLFLFYRWNAEADANPEVYA